VKRRLLGRTDFAVSETGFGAWAIGGNQYGNSYGPTDDAESMRAVRRALELGCNFFDTADVYGHGHSEDLLGAALAGVRQQVIIATKVGGNFYNRDVHPLLRERVGQAAGIAFDRIPPDAALPVTHDANFTPAYIRFAVAMSLGRLRTDYIDLLQLHSCGEEELRRGDVIEALKRACERGHTRYIGYSGDSGAALYAIQCGAFDTLQTSVSIADQEALELTLPPARERNIGVIAKRPIANAAWKSGNRRPADSYAHPYWERLRRLDYDFLQGRLNETIAVALRFTLTAPGVHTAIVGTTRPERIQQNAAILESGPLPKDLFETIRSRWREVADSTWVGET